MNETVSEFISHPHFFSHRQFWLPLWALVRYYYGLLVLYIFIFDSYEYLSILYLEIIDDMLYDVQCITLKIACFLVGKLDICTME